MKVSSFLYFIAGLLVGTLLTGAAFAARPGEAEDPLISQSYFKTGTAFRTVTLNSGESIRIAPGEEFILVDGDVRFECPGDFTVYDTSKGKSYRNPKRIDRVHLIVFMGNSSVTVITDGTAECLVRGMILD